MNLLSTLHDTIMNRLKDAMDRLQTSIEQQKEDVARYLAMDITDAIEQRAAIEDSRGTPPNIYSIDVTPSGKWVKRHGFHRPILASLPMMGGTVHDDVVLTEDDADRF